MPMPMPMLPNDIHFYTNIIKDMVFIIIHHPNRINQ